MEQQLVLCLFSVVRKCADKLYRKRTQALLSNNRALDNSAYVLLWLFLYRNVEFLAETNNRGYHISNNTACFIFLKGR